MSLGWILILGANSDMAVAVAKRYAKAGHDIYLASRNIDECEKQAADIRLRFGVKALSVAFDARQFESHASFYSDLPHAPTGVVLAFGVMYEQLDVQQNFALAQSMIETNYMGAVSILEIVSADFETKKAGFIVGISSVAGDRGRQSNYIYGSTKAGLSTYLDGLRHRLFKVGVHVMTVKPGFVDTKMTKGLDLPEKLTAKPDEVAEAIYKGVERKRNTLYVKSVWSLIMLIIRNVPEFVFKKTKL